MRPTSGIQRLIGFFSGKQRISPSDGRAILASYEEPTYDLNVIQSLIDELSIFYPVHYTPFIYRQTPTLEIKPGQETDKYIIKLNGEGGLFRSSLDSYVVEAINLKVNIIAYQYRCSTAHALMTNKNKNYLIDLVEEATGQVQRLLDSGVPAEKILVDGHSIGGVIVVYVGEHFHSQGIKINIWCDRTISSLNYLGHLYEEGVVGRHLRDSKSYKMYMDIVPAYSAIAHDSKAYRTISNYTGDGVVPKNVSLHQGVKHTKEEGYDPIRKKQDKNRSTGCKMTCPVDGHYESQYRLFLKKEVKLADSQSTVNGFTAYSWYVKSLMR